MDARLIGVGLLVAAGQALSQGFDHAHSQWDALVRKHVVVGEAGKTSRLDYSALASERAALKAYLEALARVEEREFNGWSGPQRMAFLINAYNAFTVEKILTRYPGIGSIWEFGRIFGNPFKDEFFALLGRRRSLDWIEHDNLRKRHAEPRVHFALNCASVGCPMLREEAYAPERLERQLEEQAARFLSDRSRNRAGEKGLEVSMIFDWFREDFEPREKYFARYAALLADDAQTRRRIAAGAAAISFLEYDWALNDSRSSSRR